MKKTLDESGLLRVAELVLPRLPPSDLAAAASSCKAFGREVASISSRRASDASRGVECHPIPFFNPTLDGQPYSFFLYTRVPVLPSSSMPLSARPWGGVDHPDKSRTLDDASSMSAFASPIAGSESGCGCKDCSFGGELGICPCLSPEEGAFLASGPGMELMLECGANCSCGDECLNRSTQRGVSVKLRIVKDEKKGWGLHAAQFIARGQFVCEYAGEFLTTEEARRRQRTYDELASVGKLSPALLVVREHLPSGKACLRVNIDATKVGNIARFINHSCDGGNLLTVLVRSNGSLLPRLCFFAVKDILDGEELAFSYGVSDHRKGLPCHCGSPSCVGRLPSEET
ncbi:histone-lysine N-methyltransferase SUVR3-like isoform X1 [Zingiber officinale]|uniref:Histone-lysine N-methyltransferase SUVR3 n=1 Tax=Zingiber officinale TaxID=94328 RepID=A0A8J5ICC5_ZINOF|nr:histone-lysine N-methyltransferase SUVR3-like isoform X1 [Zingiber officinale]KAG6532441.1 hypothetical protein ZIOFF_006284 [Zingiber officinale]